MSTPAHEDILWDYMDRVRWRLRRIPEAQTTDALREIRQHMQDLVADYIDAGATPEEAVWKAEEKFGSAEKVADRLVWGRERNPIYYFLCFCLYGFLYAGPMMHPVQTWQNLALCAGCGGALCLTGLLRVEMETAPKKTPTKQQKLGGYIIAAILCTAVLAYLIHLWCADQVGEAESESRVAAAFAVGYVGVYYLAKAIKRYRRTTH